MRAERTWKPGEGPGGRRRRTTAGNFIRQLFLGDSLDINRIAATYDQVLALIAFVSWLIIQLTRVVEDVALTRLDIDVDDNRRARPGCALR